MKRDQSSPGSLQAKGCRSRRTLLKSAVGLLAMQRAAAGPSDAHPDSVTLEMAREAHERGEALLIDIREAEEHARGVAAGAHLLPMSQLRQRLTEIPVEPGKLVLLICNTQNRSAAALRALRPYGYGHVRFVNGGMAEWVRRGWPVVVPPR
ncbi:MAG: rhodanese-like domain-containing protein [Inhella sp.]